MHIIFYGPEGSGKGTQAKLLSQTLRLSLITFGDLVRASAKRDRGYIGQACRRALLEGKYISDKDAFLLWGRRLNTHDAKKGWVIDGFPRSIGQAKFLVRKLKQYGYKLDYVIYLSISNEEAVKRLSNRGRKLFSGSTINHDDPRRVRERLKIYRNKEKQLLEFFKNLGMLIKIDGERTVEEIQKDIVEKLKKNLDGIYNTFL